jgi:hypothetical protein
MPMDFDLDSKIEELIELWPKKRDREFKAGEQKILEGFIKTEEDFQFAKNSIEVKIEDGNNNKLPNLVGFIAPLFNKKEQPKETLSVQEYQQPLEPVFNKTQDNKKDAEKLFLTIWDIWPRNPEFVERRQPALDAFVSAARVFPLTDLETSCRAYADSFNDGSSNGVYSKSLKNFVSDKEMVEYYIEIFNNKSRNKDNKTVFESTYAWYPDFTNKKTPKVKEASWVQYWRFIKKEDQLDFMAACRCYKQKRKSTWRSENGEMSREAIATYTKGFNAFVTEWKDAVKTGIYSNRELLEAKHDMLGDFLVQELTDNGLDVVNIWGWDDGPFFSNMALKYMFSLELSIKEAILELLKKAPEVVEQKLKATDFILKIKDADLAKKQMEGYDAVVLTEKVYQRILAVKLLEMPVEEKEWI